MDIVMTGLLLHPAYWVLRFAFATQQRIMLLAYWGAILGLGLPIMDLLSRKTRLQTILVRKVQSNLLPLTHCSWLTGRALSEVI